MTGNNKLVYLYDDTNTPYGYIYNDTPYYYERNAQGDVVGLYYQNGIKIANYTYDAWGNVTSIINQYGEDVTGLPRHQGNLNPIRYRGYYYDAELEMYWLTTRFYDPQTGRFINADGQLNGGLFGNNLYAYCSNDPVNGHDPTGTCVCCPVLGVENCSTCFRAQKRRHDPALIARPQYFDDDLLQAPRYLIPSEDFGAPNHNQFIIFSEKECVINITEEKVKELQGIIQERIDRINGEIDGAKQLAGFVIEAIICYYAPEFQNAMWLGTVIEWGLNAIVPSYSADTYIPCGEYRFTAAIYSYGNDLISLTKVIGPNGSPLTRPWTLSGMRDGVGIDDLVTPEHYLR